MDFSARIHGTVTPRELENPWRNKKKINVPGGDEKRGFEKSPRAEPKSPTAYDSLVYYLIVDPIYNNYL